MKKSNNQLPILEKILNKKAYTYCPCPYRIIIANLFIVKNVNNSYKTKQLWKHNKYLLPHRDLDARTCSQILSKHYHIGRVALGTAALNSQDSVLKVLMGYLRKIGKLWLEIYQWSEIGFVLAIKYF